MYSTSDWLSENSLLWCGIGAGVEHHHRELSFEEQTSNPSWTIHLGGVFSTECGICTLNSRGCRTTLGNDFTLLLLPCIFLGFYLLLPFCIYRSNEVRSSLECS